MTFFLHHRFRVQPKTLDAVKTHCESSEDHVWVGAKGGNAQRLCRWFLRGVPGKLLDLALADEWDGASQLAAEVGRKAGKYDSAERWQIVVRHWFAGDKQPLAAGGLIVSSDESDSHAVASAWWGACAGTTRAGIGACAAGTWMEAFPRLRTDLDDYDPRAIVLWHWDHYYRTPIEPALLDSVIAEFLLTVDLATDTLASANRLASRLLYRAARDAGWRKLTLREQQSYGLFGQWHPEEAVLRRRTDLGYPTGCGQYTTEAAQGRQAMQQAGEIRTSYGPCIVE